MSQNHALVSSAIAAKSRSTTGNTGRQVSALNVLLSCSRRGMTRSEFHFRKIAERTHGAITVLPGQRPQLGGLLRAVASFVSAASPRWRSGLRGFETSGTDLLAQATITKRRSLSPTKRLMKHEPGPTKRPHRTTFRSSTQLHRDHETRSKANLLKRWPARANDLTTEIIFIALPSTMGCAGSPAIRSPRSV
jgi:hypothetical protein